MILFPSLDQSVVSWIPSGVRWISAGIDEWTLLRNPKWPQTMSNNYRENSYLLLKNKWGQMVAAPFPTKVSHMASNWNNKYLNFISLYLKNICEGDWRNYSSKAIKRNSGLFLFHDSQASKTFFLYKITSKLRRQVVVQD